MKLDKLMALSLLVILASSCNKDDDMVPVVINKNPLENYNPQREFVNATLLGTIIDESENPVAKATVIFQGKEYLTNEEGIFIIKDENFDKNGSYFTVHKDGFFKGSRRLYPQEESTNYAYVQLMQLNTIGQFDAASGGQVIGSDNIEISFPNNSIQSSNGSLYSGQVSVAAKWLDPTAPNIGMLMPGDLLGLDNAGEEMSLVSYGMMAVELFGTAGESLNLAPERLATLTFPVPNGLQGNAPEEIPLWSFEEEEFGIWVEEGVAILEGDKYLGEVSHFSFWNCDAPYELINICGQLVTNSGIPLANTLVTIHSEELKTSRRSITNNRGFFSGKVPRNYELRLSINADMQADICGFESIMIGPFSESDGDKSNLGILDLEAFQIETFTLSGTVLDCDNNPVSYGLVKINLESHSSVFLIEDDGSFNLSVLNCDQLESFTITATDLESLEFGDPVQKDISPSIDCGDLYACGNILCVTDVQFVGNYMLTLEDAGLGYGPPYMDQVVNITTVPNSNSTRSFSSVILPEIGGFGPYNTTFEIQCENSVFLLMDSQGLGCGGSSIMFGPAYDSEGLQITASINIEDDSEIVLYFNEGFANGGCEGQTGETQTKMVLTKM